VGDPRETRPIIETLVQSTGWSVIGSVSQSDRPAGLAFVQPHLQFHKRQRRASNLGGQVTDEMTEMTGVTGIASLPKYRGWPPSFCQAVPFRRRTPRNPEGPHSERVTKNREQGRWAQRACGVECQPFHSLFAFSPTPHCSLATVEARAGLFRIPRDSLAPD
jgi:hypothetical protein